MSEDSKQQATHRTVHDIMTSSIVYTSMKHFSLAEWPSNEFCLRKSVLSLKLITHQCKAQQTGNDTATNRQRHSEPIPFICELHSLKGILVSPFFVCQLSANVGITVVGNRFLAFYCDPHISPWYLLFCELTVRAYVRLPGGSTILSKPIKTIFKLLCSSVTILFSQL